MQAALWDRPVDPSDIVYTPRYVASGIIRHLQPDGVLLDPCKGDGAFFDCFPSRSDKHYCEIAEGRDFFKCDTEADWIIGNPPYSIFFDFLNHAFSLAKNVSFLVPTNKVFQRQVVMEAVNAWGGIKSMIVYGSGNLIGFPFGFSVGNFHFQKDYTGSTELIMGMKSVPLFQR